MKLVYGVGVVLLTVLAVWLGNVVQRQVVAQREREAQVAVAPTVPVRDLVEYQGQLVVISGALVDAGDQSGLTHGWVLYDLREAHEVCSTSTITNSLGNGRLNCSTEWRTTVQRRPAALTLKDSSGTVVVDAQAARVALPGEVVLTSRARVAGFTQGAPALLVGRPAGGGFRAELVCNTSPYACVRVAEVNASVWAGLRVLLYGLALVPGGACLWVWWQDGRGGPRRRRRERPGW